MAYWKPAAWLIVACTVAVAPALATQLQGDQRTEVLKSSAGGCLTTNMKKPESRPYTLAVVDAFCTCVGTAVVDGFSIEELTEAGKQMTPEFEKRRDGFATKCSAATFGKAKPQ
jgi:hypothetical protein